MILANGTPDKVQSRAVGNLHVIVIGGGIAGLSAAVSLRQQGHKVDVYEQSLLSNEVGAAIHMTPNATGVLKQIGVDPEDSGAVHLVQTRYLSANNEVLKEVLNDETDRWQNPWLLAHRAHLHNQLKEKATADDGEGCPVRLMLASRVASVDADSATAFLDDGTSHTADVLIGADGVHSKTRAALGQTSIIPFKGKHNAFRFLIPRAVALADPETAPLVDVDGSMELWYSVDKKIVLYPTAQNTLLNFVCIHPAELSESSNDYQKTASKARLLEVFGEFHSAVVKLLSKVEPAEVKVYPLFDMTTLPTFVKGRLALIGDAAHPFTPHLAQGGAMAIEDGVSLGVLLNANTLPDQVPERLRLYETARHSRASRIQEYSRIVGRDAAEHNSDHVQDFKVHEYIEYGFSHDEIHASTRLLREHEWKQKAKKLKTRQPTVVGPQFRPSLDHNLISRSTCIPTVTTMTIKFKSSATLMRNLFPNDRYVFKKKDTVATASLCVDSYRNVPWLAGGSYNSLAIYLHDVVRTGSDGEVVEGSYVPVMFQDLADAVLSSREELGLPTLYSDIEISYSKGTYNAVVSWRGVHWAHFQLKHLKRSTVDGPTSTRPARAAVEGGEGFLVHKHISSSSSGGSGGFDANAACCLHLSTDVASSSPELLSRLTALPSDVRFDIRELGANLLPTLHPVVDRLAELPIFKILEAAVVECKVALDPPRVRHLN